MKKNTLSNKFKIKSYGNRNTQQNKKTYNVHINNT